MKRFTTISVLMVLTGWLWSPVVAAHQPACTLECCRRGAVHHSQCGGMDSEDKSNPPVMKVVSTACPAGCAFKAGSAAPVRPGGANVSIPVLSRIGQGTPHAAEGVEPKLFVFGGRAPPPFSLGSYALTTRTKSLL